MTVVLPSQTLRALLALRELILEGALRPGERLSELAIVDRLGVSRTPVRAALLRLEEEGLVTPIATGGYAVAAFSERDLRDSIALRGNLEGLAARFAAERAPDPARLQALRGCFDAMARLLAGATLSLDDFARYVTLNGQFHSVLADMADSPVLVRQLARVVAMPFASPSGFVMAQATLPEARDILTIAQDHHRCVIDAIVAREGTRAEALMREHAWLALRNLELVLHHHGALHLVPGGAYVQLRQRA